MISGEPEDWTHEDCEAMAATLLERASQRINPFSERESTDTLLLASIAASSLAVAKAQKKPVRKAS
jgi:hypothetical protein